MPDPTVFIIHCVPRLYNHDRQTFFFQLASVVRMRKVCGNKYTYKMSIAGRIKCDGATDTRRFVLKSLPEGQSVCLEVDLKSRTWSPFKIDASEKQTPLY